MKHLLFTDGGARGNPGPAGAGAVLCDSSGKVIAKKQKYLGEITNNQAEYLALLLGLQLAADNDDCEKLVIFMDSNLAVEQMAGRWKIKDAELRRLWERAQRLVLQFEKVEFKHIPREKNAKADALANQAMDARK